MDIPKGVFDIAYLCGTQGRLALQNVRFSQAGKKCTAVATNAKCLIVLEWEDDNQEPEDFEVLVDKKVCHQAKILGSGKKGQRLVRLQVAGDSYAFACDGGQLAGHGHDGRFPKIADLMPPDNMSIDHFHVRLNAKLLIDLLQAMLRSEAASSRANGVDLYFLKDDEKRASQPMVIKSPNFTFPAGTCLLMPVVDGK